ncbi:MAG TPA: tetratricopeptide repeat protein [Nitrospirota bacterium]|nr:tetratricopeptide repeat protein [Nitrospirota bacterium]
MGKKRILTLIVFLSMGLVTLTAHAADELFDTEAAAGHMNKGIAYLKAKNFDDAVREFDEAASISPEAEPYYYLGYAYYLKSREGDGESRKLSLENFQKAYEIDPNFTPTRYKPAEPSPLQGSQQPQPGAIEAPSVTQQQTAPAAEPEAQKPAETATPQTTPQTPPAEQPK